MKLNSGVLTACAAVFGLAACSNGPTLPERPALPKGAIIGWYGGAAIPDGFVICDGDKGVPNLAGRYPVGTKNPKEVGAEIGNAGHSHGFALTTGRPRVEEGGAPDGYGPQPTRGSAPQATGLDHRHRVTGTIDTADHTPPSTKIVFICKT